MRRWKMEQTRYKFDRYHNNLTFLYLIGFSAFWSIPGILNMQPTLARLSNIFFLASLCLFPQCGLNQVEAGKQDNNSSTIG